MKVEIVTSLERLEELRPAWTDLADAADAPIHATPFWAIPWWRHHGRGALRVGVVHDSGGLGAVMTLHERARGGFRVARFFGDDLGSTSTAVVRPGAPEAGTKLWEELLSDRDRVLDLRRHRLFGAGLDALWRSGDQNWTAGVSNVCPVVASEGSFDSYLAGRGSRLRRVLTRAPKLALDDGYDVETFVCTTEDGVLGLFDELLPLWDAAEVANPRTHFLRPPYADFTREVLTGAAREQRLALVGTRISGSLAGAAFGYRVGSMYHYSGPRFHPDLQRYSPGHLTLRRLVEHAFANNCGLDLLLGGQEYKWQWASTSYSVADVLAAGSPRALRAARYGLRGVQWAQDHSWALRQRLRRE
jgi:CelD/BcsL family acetyltransferase involved in cellulose biosynthesis